MTQPGHVVLVDYPFTDRPARKRRPALVLAERPDYAGEYLVAFISSRMDLFEPRWDIVLDPHQPRDSQTRLRVTSVVKTTKVTIISGESMAGRLGKAHPSVLKDARQRLIDWLSA